MVVLSGGGERGLTDLQESTKKGFVFNLGIENGGSEVVIFFFFPFLIFLYFFLTFSFISHFFHFLFHFSFLNFILRS